jgi:hypothetical protein
MMTWIDTMTDITAKHTAMTTAACDAMTCTESTNDITATTAMSATMCTMPIGASITPAAMDLKVLSKMTDLLVTGMHGRGLMLT